MTRPPLDGIRVLDLSRLLPGPFCTLYLAQMGAEVIKIEDPAGGDYARGSEELFALVNRGKKSVTLDLRQPQDQARLKALVKTADVLIESFRPGVMARFGCDYDSLKAINPKLVYASLTGYGHSGPYRDWAGHDMNYLAISGVLDQIGRAGAGPALSNLQIADLGGGALTCAMGILAAVIGARQSGQGSFVDVAMMDGSLALQPIALSVLRGEGRVPRRGDEMLTGALPNYSLYRCRDGKYLAVGALEPKFFMTLLGVLSEQIPAPLRQRLEAAVAAGRGAGAKLRRGGQSANRKPAEKLPGKIPGPRYLNVSLRWALQAIFLSRRRDDWAQLLAGRDCCVTPVLNLQESLANEQVRARELVEDDGGKPAFALPIQFSSPRPILGQAPTLGADNAEILGAVVKRPKRRA